MGDDDVFTADKAMVHTIEDFIAASGAGPSSLSVYDERLHRVERWLGEMHAGPSLALLEASKRDLVALKQKLRGMQSGPHIAVILRMFYRAAGRADIAEFLKIKQRQKKLSPDDILEPREVDELVRFATDMKDRALFVALWNTGERISAVLAVNLGDVKAIASPENGGKKFYRIHFRKTKRNEPHDGFITEAVDVFESWLRIRTTAKDAGASAPLFVSFEGRRLSKEAAEKIVRTTAKRAGMTKHVHPHLFRHSRATHLLRLKVPELQVKRLLGWAPSSTMLSKYVHLSMGDAYASLLQAQGYKVPDVQEYGRILEAAEAGLEDVVPMVRPPAAVEPSSPTDIPALASVIAEEVMKRLLPDVAATPGAWEQGKVRTLPEMIEAALRKARMDQAKSG